MVKSRGCGEVIGVYEPMIFLVDGDARETSVAAVGRHAVEAARRFHRACLLGPKENS